MSCIVVTDEFVRIRGSPRPTMMYISTLGERSLQCILDEGT